MEILLTWPIFLLDGWVQVLCVVRGFANEKDREKATTEVRFLFDSCVVSKKSFLRDVRVKN